VSHFNPMDLVVPPPIQNAIMPRPRAPQPQAPPQQNQQPALIPALRARANAVAAAQNAPKATPKPSTGATAGGTGVTTGTPAGPGAAQSPIVSGQPSPIVNPGTGLDFEEMRRRMGGMAAGAPSPGVGKL
jgi:hypothetical protein